MASSLDEGLAREMAAWEAAGLRRNADGGPVDGRVDFTSNDVLDFSRRPELVDAAREALERSGAGSRASRLLGGGSPDHVRCERAAAEWLGAEEALLFPSGWHANLGVVTALAGRGDALFCDRLLHASLVDAARLSRARVFVHAHLDLEELERQLARARGARRRLVLTEGVFSMDGDAAPLAALHELCERHDASLVVDEAHAAGLLGPEGAGAVAEAGLAPDAARVAPRLAARVVTGGKALGVGGAFVVGSRRLRDHLWNRARTFVYTTAPPPAVAASLAKAIELARGADELRRRALDSARTLAGRVGAPEPAAAIVSHVVGTSERAMELAARLRKAGFEIHGVRPPTVPEGTARLRLVCRASHSAAEIDDLARHLEEEGGGTTSVASSKQAGEALVVVGTDTDVGKTVVSALLFLAARRLGPAGYWKPVQTGSDSDTDTVGRLSDAQPHELLHPAWQLALPASPHEAAAAEGKTIDPRRVEEGLGGLRRVMPDARLIVELAGGLHVPYVLTDRDDGGADPFTQADWLERAALPCVLVARSALGTLNHTALSLEGLRARHLEPRALFLVGEPHPSNRETLAKTSGVERFFEVPRFPVLDQATLEAWLDENDLSPLFDG